MKNRGLIILLAAILSLPAAAGGTKASIQTTEGSQLTGTVDLEKLTVQSDVGKVELEISKVSRLAMKGDQATIQLFDTNTIVGKLSITSFKITTSLGELDVPLEKIKSITFMGSGGANPVPVPPGKPPPNADDAIRLAADSELKPEARMDGPCNFIGRTVLSADASRIYFLDYGAGKAVALDTATMKVAASVEAPKGALSLSIAPGERTLWVVAPSTICLFDLPAMTARKAFQIEHKLVDVHAIDDAIALGALDSSVIILDSEKQAAIVPAGRMAGGPFTLVPGSDRVYQYQGWMSWKADASKPGGLDLQLSQPASYAASAAGILVSRDARFAITPTGAVVRLAKSYLADLQECGRVSASLSGIALSEKYLLFTVDGFLKIHDAGNFELKTSVKVGVLGLAAHGDEKSGKAWVFGSASRPSGQPRMPSHVGTWFRYKIP
ncbi:MAG: hypothetical protein AAB074_08155 [Planctomycetota bacterium]